MSMPDIRKVFSDLGEISGQALLMPMPKRMALDEVKALKRVTLGESFDRLLKDIAATGVSATTAYGMLQESDAARKVIADKQFTKVTIVSLYMITKHMMRKAPLFSVNPALNLLLEDTAIKVVVPAMFFAPPFPECFVEFDPAERRIQSERITYSGGEKCICEGAYIQETKFERLPPVSRDVREVLELDPNKPARVIEIGFSASPVNSTKAEATGAPVAFDNVDLISIYIQDEQEPISDILDRHFELYSQRMSDTHCSDEDNSFVKLFKGNFAHLTKILFYLHVEKSQRRTELEESKLSERISQVQEKKKEKLKKQLTRVYDRIVVGPDNYTPIKDLVSTSNLPKGTKSPHYRRGYFGIRWKGVGENKVPELVKVSHTIINESLMKQSLKDGKDKSPKDYEIR